MPKISSTHKFILKIQHILGYHELNGYIHFWPCPPKNNWKSFYFSWVCTSMQKISSFHLFIIEIQPILESCPWPDWLHPFLIMSTQKYFDTLFYICINMQKIRLFDCFALADQKIMQSDWLKTFWSISQK